MSDEMKNCCPPETTAPKMEVHDASESSKDIKPKMISTAHKQLSKDEFQRKVAMVARFCAAENAGLEKAAWGAVARGLWSLGGKSLLSNASKLWGGTKALATTGVLPSVANMQKTWMNMPLRALVGQKGLGSYYMHPVSLAGQALAAGQGAMPYVGGAMHRLGSGLQSAAHAMGSTIGLNSQNGAGGMGNVAGGGLIGAGIGALGGALMPGQEEYEDENGNVRKRSRGMLSGALRGAGMGGLAGAGVGAGMDAYNSGAFKFGSAMCKVAADPGFTPSGAPTANWANKGYNPHQAVSTPPTQAPFAHAMDADKARYQFATAPNPQAKVNAQTAFTQAARAANSGNVAAGGKPVYSATQKPMDLTADSAMAAAGKASLMPPR